MIYLLTVKIYVQVDNRSKEDEGRNDRARVKEDKIEMKKERRNIREMKKETKPYL